MSEEIKFEPSIEDKFEVIKKFVSEKCSPEIQEAFDKDELDSESITMILHNLPESVGINKLGKTHLLGNSGTAFFHKYEGWKDNDGVDFISFNTLPSLNERRDGWYNKTIFNDMVAFSENDGENDSSGQEELEKILKGRFYSLPRKK